MHRALRVALSKVEHHSGRIHRGYLVPQEVIELAKAGAEFSADTLTYARIASGAGIAGPRWVYFKLPGHLKGKP